MIYIRTNEIRERFQNKVNEAKKIYPSLMLQIGLNLKVKNIGEQCNQVSKGKHDKEILELIKSIKNYKNPVFLRIEYEFNNPTHNYKPKEFLAYTLWGRPGEEMIKKTEQINLLYLGD